MFIFINGLAQSVHVHLIPNGSLPRPIPVIMTDKLQILILDNSQWNEMPRKLQPITRHVIGRYNWNIGANMTPPGPG